MIAPGEPVWRTSDLGVPLRITVNGRETRRTVSPRTSLADFLRDGLGLTGLHLGCEHGACGACAVLLDGRSVRACIVLAAQVDGCSVETIEGISQGGNNALQQAISRHHGLQCGFCTPGFVVMATELLRELEQTGMAVDEVGVRERLAGNFCRCTGYQGIVEAVLDAASHREG